MMMICPFLPPHKAITTTTTTTTPYKSRN
jgi:hypothetical protein